MSGRTAICPGSYDPVTNGHLDIIGRAARIFDRVIVGVVNQPLRKQTTLFTAEERAGFIERATADMANVEALGVSDHCEVVRGDAIRFLGRDPGSYDLVFCDPPYRLARRFASELEELLPDRLRAGGRVIVESRAVDPLELGLPLLDSREYGSTAIRIHGGER